MSFIRSTLTVLISAALVCDLAALNPGAQPFRRSSRLGKPESSGIGGDVSCTGASSPSSPSSFSSSPASSSSAPFFSASRTNNVRLKSAASIDPFSMETSRRIDNVHYSVYPNSFAKKMTSFDVYEALTTQASLGVKKLQDLPVKERLAIGLAESWKWFQWRLQENIRTATQSEDIRQELSNSFEKLRDIASGDSELGIAAAASSNAEAISPFMHELQDMSEDSGFGGESLGRVCVMCMHVMRRVLCCSRSGTEAGTT